MFIQFFSFLICLLDFSILFFSNPRSKIGLVVNTRIARDQMLSAPVNQLSGFKTINHSPHPPQLFYLNWFYFSYQFCWRELKSQESILLSILPKT